MLSHFKETDLEIGLCAMTEKSIFAQRYFLFYFNKIIFQISSVGRAGVL